MFNNASKYFLFSRSTKSKNGIIKFQLRKLYILQVVYPQGFRNVKVTFQQVLVAETVHMPSFQIYSACWNYLESPSFSKFQSTETVWNLGHSVIPLFGNLLKLGVSGLKPFCLTSNQRSWNFKYILFNKCFEILYRFWDILKNVHHQHKNQIRRYETLFEDSFHTKPGSI